MCRTLADFYLEAGKVYTREEYKRLDKVPYSLLSLKKLLGSYSKTVSLVERYYPHHMKLVRLKEKADKLQTLKATLEGIKSEKTQAKPAVKPAVIKDKDDE